MKSEELGLKALIEYVSELIVDCSKMEESVIINVDPNLGVVWVMSLEDDEEKTLH